MQLLRVLSGVAGLTALAAAASLQQVSSFGNNPSGVQMFIYVPDNVAAKPAIIIGLHPCGGSAQQFYSSTQMPSYADRQGFVLIYGQTTKNSNCWEVNNSGSLTHGGSGDALGIVSMVNYALSKYSGDASKVWVFGASSGAMMTNVMAGSYPDVFEAGSVYSGVAHACFFGDKDPPTPFGANQTCAQGLQHTPQEWANFVYNSYPGYSGRRTRMQIWHGGADPLVVPQCATEQTKQWSQVLQPGSSRQVSNTPSSGWTQTLWGDGSKLVEYTNPSVGHYAPVNEQAMLAFFSLGASGGSGPTSTVTRSPPTTSTTPGGPSSSTTTRATTTSPPPTVCTSALYGQCGGSGWTGCTSCASGSKCVFSNNWYSQCLPA